MNFWMSIYWIIYDILGLKSMFFLQAYCVGYIVTSLILSVFLLKDTALLLDICITINYGCMLITIVWWSNIEHKLSTIIMNMDNFKPIWIITVNCDGCGKYKVVAWWVDWMCHNQYAEYFYILIFVFGFLIEQEYCNLSSIMMIMTHVNIKY